MMCVNHPTWTTPDVLFGGIKHSGYEASFNPSHPGNFGNPYGWWVSPWQYGLNQGPIIVMIENYRSGLVWRLM